MHRDCTCKCHKENFAGEEPFCIGCTNDYSNLCRRDDDDDVDEAELIAARKLPGYRKYRDD